MSWRGIGAFLLFVVLYMVISPAVGVIAIYAVNNPVVHKLIDLFGGNNQTIVGVIAAGLGSLVGMSLAIIAHTQLWKSVPHEESVWRSFYCKRHPQLSF
jgi:ABC-type glycerol-3-phosphate transport system permease component